MAGVGKSSLAKKFTDPNFKTGDHMATLGVDMKTQFLMFLGEPIKIKIWDTAGQERYGTLTKNYVNSLDGALLVYALNEYESIKKTAEWKKTLT